jgi:hypothetical protein
MSVSVTVSVAIYCWEDFMKTIAVVISLAVSTIAVSGPYQAAYADSRMTGSPYWCSSGMNCMQDRYNAATGAAKAKAQ